MFKYQQVGMTLVDQKCVSNVDYINVKYVERSLYKTLYKYGCKVTPKLHQYANFCRKNIANNNVKYDK